MSQRDLAAELRAARITVPFEVRERVRAIAATDSTAREPRFTWRRALVVALPVAAALAATIVFTRPTQHAGTALELQATKAATVPTAVPDTGAKSFSGTGHVRAGVAGVPTTAIPVPPSRTRLQRYGASLALSVSTPDGISAGVQRALRIVASLGGHPTSVHASSRGRSAHAELVLRIPRRNVQRAVTRLSQLGTITGEQVDVQDVQGDLDATSRTVTRLQGTLRDLRAQVQTPDVVRRITAISTRIASLQRGEASTIRTASFATVRLSLATPTVKVAPHHSRPGPFHWLGRALFWLGIGAVYALALGIPLALLAFGILLIVRIVRRRREDALLNRT